MRICAVGPAYPFRGGIAHHNTELCKRLAERHDVHAVTFSRLYPSMFFPGKSQTDPSVSGGGDDPDAVPMLDALNPITWARTGDYVRGLDADLVLVQWWQPFFGPCLATVASRARERSRVAYICHNVLPHERMPFGRRMALAALSKGDGFIVHSGQDLQDLHGLFPGLSPDVVRKTVLPESTTFPRKGISKESARRMLDLSGRVVLFFGLVRKYKGLMDLLDALPLTRTKDLTCLIAGEFYDSKAKYVSRIEELRLDHRVRIIDRYVPNEEVEQFFAAADVVVLPYRSATQSGIVQMAFRYERPVIATSVGGLPESIDDGRTGLMVTPNDPRALAYAIDKYFEESLEQEFVEAIREDEARFSWDRVTETIESLGETLCE